MARRPPSPLLNPQYHKRVAGEEVVCTGAKNMGAAGVQSLTRPPPTCVPWGEGPSLSVLGLPYAEMGTMVVPTTPGCSTEA